MVGKITEMFPYIVWIISFCFFCNVWALHGPNVCFNSNSSEAYCCSDYEEENMSCKPCGIGYTSVQGKSCKPCEPNYFGYRCIKKCNCQTFLRCDNVLGCVSANRSIETRTVSTGSYLPEDDSVDLAEENPNNSNNDMKQNPMLIYTTVTTSIIITLAALWIYYRWKKKRRTEQNGDKDKSSEEPPLHENVYNIIDESLMDDTEQDFHKSGVVQNPSTNESTHKTPMVERAVGESNPEVKGAKNDRDSYLHPYNMLRRADSGNFQNEYKCLANIAPTNKVKSGCNDLLESEKKGQIQENREDDLISVTANN